MANRSLQKIKYSSKVSQSDEKMTVFYSHLNIAITQFHAISLKATPSDPFKYMGGTCRSIK